jgi:hypothetical protein
MICFPDDYISASTKYDSSCSIIYLSVPCFACNSALRFECDNGNCSDRISYFIYNASVHVRACAEILSQKEIVEHISPLSIEDLVYITEEEYDNL